MIDRSDGAAKLDPFPARGRVGKDYLSSSKFHLSASRQRLSIIAQKPLLIDKAGVDLRAMT